MARYHVYETSVFEGTKSNLPLCIALVKAGIWFGVQFGLSYHQNRRVGKENVCFLQKNAIFRCSVLLSDVLQNND